MRGIRMLILVLALGSLAACDANFGKPATECTDVRLMSYRTIDSAGTMSNLLYQKTVCVIAEKKLGG